ACRRGGAARSRAGCARAGSRSGSLRRSASARGSWRSRLEHGPGRAFGGIVQLDPEGGEGVARRVGGGEVAVGAGRGALGDLGLDVRGGEAAGLGAAIADAGEGGLRVAGAQAQLRLEGLEAAQGRAVQSAREAALLAARGVA